MLLAVGELPAPTIFPTLMRLGKGFDTPCALTADEVADGRMPVCVRACPMRALHYVDPDEFDTAT